MHLRPLPSQRCPLKVLLAPRNNHRDKDTLWTRLFQLSQFFQLLDSISAPHLYFNTYITILDYSNFWVKTEDWIMHGYELFMQLLWKWLTNGITSIT